MGIAGGRQALVRASNHADMRTTERIDGAGRPGKRGTIINHHDLAVPPALFSGESYGFVQAAPLAMARDHDGNDWHRETQYPVSRATQDSARLASFCRETRFPRVRPLPDGRGSDAKSHSINEVIRATTVREGLLRLSTAVSRQKLASRVLPWAAGMC